MGPIGVPELSIILVIIVIIFGVGKLSAITLGYRDHEWSEHEAIWRTPALDDLVIYELMISEFGGSVDGTIDRLDYLADLGVDGSDPFHPLGDTPRRRLQGRPRARVDQLGCLDLVVDKRLPGSLRLDPKTERKNHGAEKEAQRDDDDQGADRGAGLAALDQAQVDDDHRDQPEETELLTDRGEDEVRLGVRDPLGHALAEAAPDHAAPPEAVEGLDELVAAAVGIGAMGTSIADVVVNPVLAGARSPEDALKDAQQKMAPLFQRQG